MDLTITIPDEKVNDFKAGFLAKCPIPMIEDPDNEGETIPEFTPKQWIKEWIRRDVLRAYRFGRKMLAEADAVIDEEIIT